MEQTVLDSPYNRNRMQTLFATIGGAYVAQPVALPKRQKRMPALPVAVALWWSKLKRHSHKHTARRDALGAKTRAHKALRTSFPQRAAAPRLSRDAARWRAQQANIRPAANSSADFFAVLDGMGARHRAAARRDHLIHALEASIGERRTVGERVN